MDTTTTENRRSDTLARYLDDLISGDVFHRHAASAASIARSGVLVGAAGEHAWEQMIGTLTRMSVEGTPVENMIAVQVLSRVENMQARPAHEVVAMTYSAAADAVATLRVDPAMAVRIALWLHHAARPLAPVIGQDGTLGWALAELAKRYRLGEQP